MRTMYDAVTPANIPADAVMVAGYIDGRYKWGAADWARFPGAVKLEIAVFASTNAGEIGDCETGDMTPSTARQWANMRHASGLARPTIYCNTSTIGFVRDAMAGAPYGWDWWAAHYTGQPHLEPGSVATQYADPGPYDLSLVTDAWYPGGNPMADGFTDADRSVLQTAYNYIKDGQNGPDVSLPMQQLNHIRAVVDAGAASAIPQNVKDALKVVADWVAAGG